MKQHFKFIVAIAILMNLSVGSKAIAEDSKWFLRSNLGISNLSDFSANSESVFGASVVADIRLGSGQVAGLGIGYRLNSNISTEFAWEYRSNDSEVSLANGKRFEEGNYASNTFFLNALYHFDSVTKWRPYIGIGLGWLQEIDIDLESSGQEFSYSANGDIGFQIMGGVDYRLSDTWQLQAELRFSDFSDIKLESENGSIGSFNNFEYSPMTFQLALVYAF